MRSISSNVSFKTCVSLLIFSFDDQPIGVSGVLKSPIIIVLLSISPFMSVSSLEKEMVTLSSVLAWRIPGTGEPGGLPSLGSHIVGHD